jgi:hypothetical protein
METIMTHTSTEETMKRRKTWLTKSGVEVYSRGRFMERSASGRDRGWKIYAHRVSTGGFMGWLWLKNLREVSP